MTLYYFLVEQLINMLSILVLLLPVSFYTIYKKRQPKPIEYVAMPDIEYKVRVGVAKRYLKSKGIRCE